MNTITIDLETYERLKALENEYEDLKYKKAIIIKRIYTGDGFETFYDTFGEDELVLKHASILTENNRVKKEYNEIKREYDRLVMKINYLNPFQKMFFKVKHD